MLVGGKRGVGASGGEAGEVVDVGLMTTPQLHHCVRMENCRLGDVRTGKERSGGDACPVVGGGPGWQGEEGYVRLLASSYLALCSTADPTAHSPAGPPAHPSLPSSDLWLDCAHGIGALKFPALAAAVNKGAGASGRREKNCGRKREGRGGRMRGARPEKRTRGMGQDKRCNVGFIRLLSREFGGNELLLSCSELGTPLSSVFPSF